MKTSLLRLISCLIGMMICCSHTHGNCGTTTFHNNQDGISCTPASVNVSIKYSNDMDPIITGSVYNGTGCFWEGRRSDGENIIVYRGGGHNITAIEVNMMYDGYSGHYKIPKVIQVNIAPNKSGKFSVSFPKITSNGCEASYYIVSAVRFSDGSIYMIRETGNLK